MATTDRADIKKVYFFCDADVATDFIVQEFTSSEKISQLYSFTITLTSQNHNIALDSVINANAALFIYRKGKFYSYTGIITEFSYCETTVDYSVYEVKLMPQVWRLSQTYQSRVFQKMSIPDIIAKVFEDSGLDDYCDFQTNLNTYPQREYVVQYEETDLQFISRLMESEGIWYFFKLDPVDFDAVSGSDFVETMIITDDPEQFKIMPVEPEIIFKNISGMVQQSDTNDLDNIYELRYSRKVISEKVTLKNYNYRTPDVDLSAEKAVTDGDCGFIYEYGGDYKNITEAQQSVAIEASREAIKQIVLQGKSHCRGLRAGNRIEIVEHDKPELNQQYVITAVEHAGTFSKANELFENPSYSNTFQAIPSDKASFFTPQKSEHIKALPGILGTTIETLGSDYASLDDTGRYKVRFPFDLSEAENYEASKYIRLAQAYSGPDYGIHFPSHERSEMIVGHVDNNTNKPIGLGTIPHANTISPVTNNNHTVSVVKTAGENVINLDDVDGKEKILFSTPKAMSTSVGGNQSISVGHDRSSSATGNGSKHIAGNQEITIEGKKVENYSGNKDETVSGNNTVTITGNREETYRNSRSSVVSGDSTATYESSRAIGVKVSNTEKYSADCNITVDKVYAHLSKAPLTLSSNSEVSIDAAETIGVESVAITIMGKTSVKIEVGGSSVELSPAEVKFDSPTGVVGTSGSLITTIGGVVMIKGLPVNIN